MDKISMKEFLLRQPAFPRQTETDGFYLAIANRLLDETDGMDLSARLHEGVRHKIALIVTDYLQDIVSDAGLWRSFVDANRQLYGFSVPFHDIPENYIDYELNREDVRFLVWYAVAMLSDEFKHIYPHDRMLLELADACFEILDSVYEEAPVPEDFNISRGLEFNDAEDHKTIYQLGNWLFLHSYLLTPAYAESLRDIVMSVDRNDPDNIVHINERLEAAMMEDTTGPLALYTPEWVYLMLERKLPEKQKTDSDKGNHPYYESFIRYTGGEVIRFFDSYDAMNGFFIEALGWAAGERHLEQAAGAHDYTLMVTPHKGMLMARDIARCINAPGNPYYDKEYAAAHAFELLSERGLCPGDLLRYIFEKGWLTDAVFPGTDDTDLVRNYQDFIARCYLQIYYRGD